MNPTELENLIGQTSLQIKGYYKGALDGRWGPISRRAAAAWFTESKKDFPGINATAENLRALAAQVLLGSYGYYDGKLDGQWGTLSKAAAAKWAGYNVGAVSPEPSTIHSQPSTSAPAAPHSYAVYDIAKQYLGTREIPGIKNNPLIVQWGRKIVSWWADDETAWCSVFVNECAEQAGYERSGKVNARSWMDVGDVIDLAEARKGDVIILWRGSRNGWEGHVAILDHYNAQRGLLYLLGGNQNNEVNITAYAVGKLLGVRRLRSLDRLQGGSNRI